MVDSETTPVWKKLYHIISGGNTTVTGDVVEEILILCKDKVIKGFLEYTPFTRRSFRSWKKHSGLKDIVEDKEMCNFIHLLSKELNLDTNVAWTVMCNFLMFEYFGKIDELKSIIRYERNVRYLIENIWYYYSADRMFLLKSLRHIFENVTDKEYKFYNEFNDFLKSIKIEVLWKNLKKMLENLIMEISIDKAQMVSRDILINWIHRNNREQVETIMLLIHVIQFSKLDGHELEDLLTIFLKHGFTRHLIYHEATKVSRPKDIFEIKSAEIGCVLAVMDRYWQNPRAARMISSSMEKSLEQLQIQGDNSIVLFSWAVLKTSISNTEESMDYCNKIICELIEKKVFKSLYQLLLSNIFDKCRSGDIVIDAIFKLMTELIKICADYSFLHEQEDLCYITAELLKRKRLVVFEYLGPIFQLSMDAFPFVFNPFLEMCKALLTIPEQFDKIMKLLYNIPSFLSEILWSDHRNRFQLEESRQLFTDSDLFIIPRGTTVEKFTYLEKDYARFIYPFSFFTLMEQFMRFTNFSSSDTTNLTELVLIGFKFIIHILNHYQGNFTADRTLRRLINRLEIIPNQFIKRSTMNFNFIRLYMEINVTLITCNLLDFQQTFSPLMQKKFFPQAVNYTKIDKDHLNQTHFDSVLFKCLKEEEGMKDHSILINYLKLLKYMVENDKYQEEVQLAGIWYILNIAFPLHQQWPYEDETQMMTICKLSVVIFVKVLNNPRVNEKNASDTINKMCINAFMFEEVLMSSFLSVFCKDKFYVQNLMQQESNWMSGPVLQDIESIRLQMSLLLSVYKIRCGLPATKRCTIDNKIGTISKAISTHIINPYNATLRMLAYKFMEILARDENIPMMALLELDYDQVQRLFLDKLRDPMEDDNVKMQILDLISTCIFTQHGMTAALFNVTRSRRWHSDIKEKQTESDTVTDFMIDYLQNIRKSHEYLKSPLQVAILRVMSNLWLSRKRHLIRDIMSLEAFWPLLVDPIFKEYNHTPSVYAYIFKILGTQFGDTSINKQFTSTVEKFLTNEKLLEEWQMYLIKMSSDSNLRPSDIEEKEALLKAWAEFILMTENQKNLKKITSEQSKFLFIELCLDGIQFSFANTHCIDHWMNMCLIFMTNWGVNFKSKEKIIVKKLTEMFSIIKLHYNELSSQTRSIILTIILSILKDLKLHFESHGPELVDFLMEMGPLLDHEYIVLEEVWTKVHEDSVGMKERMIPWLMCINIANKLIKFKNSEVCYLWFSYRNYLQNLVKCVSNLINKPQTMTFCKIAMYSLQLYVESPLGFDFLNCNMANFYDSIEQPLTALFINQSNKFHVDELEEGWLTCTFLMRFNRAFLKKFQYKALSTCYTYITLHERILNQIMLIPEQMVALKPLDLLLATLIFFDEILVNWQDEWYRKSNYTYMFIMNSVKKMVNACLYLILRPKNIVLYELDDHYRLNQVDKVPMALMATIMNRLVRIVGLCFSVLYRVNFSLLNLMGFVLKDTFSIFIENDFSVPKFELPIPYELTYGKLLCLAHFMSKTLDSLSNTSSSVAEEIKDKCYNKCIGLVEHQDSGYNFPSQKLGAYVRYAMYEYSGLADPWVQKLNQKDVKRSFELLMAFLSQQVFLYVRTTTDSENMPYFKRNLASELQFFYEHVKKQTSLLFNERIATVQTISSYRTEMDVVKRYLIYCRQNNKFEEAADNNFGVAIMHWFIKICQIQ